MLPNGSFLKSNHREHIQLSTRRHSHSQWGFRIWYAQFQVLFDKHPYRWPNEGLRTLQLGVSLEAIHDSAERYPPANCHPDTCKAVRQIILDWIGSESGAASFFWLYGPAGAGKTAILQAIAEFLCRSPSGSRRNFRGSFFFLGERKGAMYAIFCSQQSHISSLWMM